MSANFNDVINIARHQHSSFSISVKFSLFVPALVLVMRWAYFIVGPKFGLDLEGETLAVAQAKVSDYLLFLVLFLIAMFVTGMISWWSKSFQSYVKRIERAQLHLRENLDKLRTEQCDDWEIQERRQEEAFERACVLVYAEYLSSSIPGISEDERSEIIGKLNASLEKISKATATKNPGLDFQNIERMIDEKWESNKDIGVTICKETIEEVCNYLIKKVVFKKSVQEKKWKDTIERVKKIVENKLTKLT